jgi:hypothetical protein
LDTIMPQTIVTVFPIDICHRPIHKSHSISPKAAVTL